MLKRYFHKCLFGYRLNVWNYLGAIPGEGGEPQIGEDGQPIVPVAAAEAEAAAEVPVVPAEPEKLKTPPPPPPFEYAKDLPPEGAEVPFVKVRTIKW